MWGMITGFFSSTTNILMAIGSAIVVGYVGKLKYDSYRAEDKLKNIETKIAKTNVVVAKTKAKAKAKAVKAETTAEVAVLRELKVQAKKAQKEMEVIEKTIETTLKDKVQKKVLRSRKKIRIEV